MTKKNSFGPKCHGCVFFCSVDTLGNVDLGSPHLTPSKPFKNNFISRKVARCPSHTSLDTRVVACDYNQGKHPEKTVMS